jgi:hypothetical protein
MPFSFRPLVLGLALFFVPQLLLSAAAQSLIANRFRHQPQICVR